MSQVVQNKNVEKFRYRLKNFFRPAGAARDVPPGQCWAFANGDDLDPYTDPEWLRWWQERGST